MNQEEADQDVADEVSEEVDSRGKVVNKAQCTQPLSVTLTVYEHEISHTSVM